MSETSLEPLPPSSSPSQHFSQEASENAHNTPLNSLLPKGRAVPVFALYVMG